MKFYATSYLNQLYSLVFFYVYIFMNFSIYSLIIYLVLSLKYRIAYDSIVYLVSNSHENNEVFEWFQLIIT
mgnify:FL=1